MNQAEVTPGSEWGQTILMAWNSPGLSHWLWQNSSGFSTLILNLSKLTWYVKSGNEFTIRAKVPKNPTIRTPFVASSSNMTSLWVAAIIETKQNPKIDGTKTCYDLQSDHFNAKYFQHSCKNANLLWKRRSVQVFC